MDKRIHDTAQALSAIWNYDEKVINDVAELVQNFEDANELMEFIESEDLNTAFEGVQLWKEYKESHDSDRYNVADDFCDMTIARLCEEEGVCYNEFVWGENA